MYVVRVHLSRPVKVKGKARGPRLEISSLWREVDFVSTSEGDKGEAPLIEETEPPSRSVALKDEDKSGRRDLNPQPQPWQGYALPLSYFRQLR
ncbi:hypothetical protein E6C27_scaffold46649G00020 [Cucumis melo var. makuwa]|uniref:Uncharacterized protein n=1 Tax=Cucumis melo var. makuwa TaxID=1194695 RepID=A0A5A7V7C5_CUCMM|nr:hypothetical protein E6C27_scaffold46649G00020 [Cucumis melo var. makuwa]